MADITASNIDAVLRSQLDAISTSVEAREVGTVAEVGDGIARVEGLRGAMAGELLEFETSDGSTIMGMALNLDEREVGAVLLGDFIKVKENDSVKTTGKIVQVPAGDGMLGRIVGPLGNPLRFRLAAATEESAEALKGLGTYGFVRGASAFIVGAVSPGDRHLEDYGHALEQLVLLATSRKGYGSLCRLITEGRRRSEKGSSRVGWREVYEHAEDLIALWGGDRGLIGGEADPFFVAHGLREAQAKRIVASIRVADLARSIEFYEGLLGLRPIPRPDFGIPGRWYGIGNAKRISTVALTKTAPEGSATSPTISPF